MANQRTLYSKDISKIIFDDIEAFFNLKIREGLRLEYKSDFPSDLSKYIVAMANTAGGIILIGISANQTTNEPEEISGISLVKGLEERVINICESNIKPILIPEIKVCPFKINELLSEPDKTVLLIRIAESEVSPHICLRNNGIWIRLHNRCALADLETIERLIEKRDKSAIELKETISFFNIEAANRRAEFPDSLNEYLTFYIITPKFPMKKIYFTKQIDDYVRSQINEISRFNQYILYPEHIEFSHRNNDNKLLRFCMINNSGSLLYIEPISFDNDKIYVEDTIRTLYSILVTIKELYKYFKIFSDVFIKIEYRWLPNLKLSLFIDRFHDVYKPLNKHKYYSVSNKVAHIDLTKDNNLQHIFIQILRLFGCSLKEEVIKMKVHELL